MATLFPYAWVRGERHEPVAGRQSGPRRFRRRNEFRKIVVRPACRHARRPRVMREARVEPCLGLLGRQCVEGGDAVDEQDLNVSRDG